MGPTLLTGTHFKELWPRSCWPQLFSDTHLWCLGPMMPACGAHTPHPGCRLNEHACGFLIVSENAGVHFRHRAELQFSMSVMRVITPQVRTFGGESYPPQKKIHMCIYIYTCVYVCICVYIYIYMCLDLRMPFFLFGQFVYDIYYAWPKPRMIFMRGGI